MELQEEKDGKDKFKMKNNSLESQEKKNGKVNKMRKNKGKIMKS